jgi:predicted Rossmann fold nucleotide-binding protein DprA/Smf involved in DNA uptake
MPLDSSLSWLATTLTPGLASRLSSRLLRGFESPEGNFRATLPQLGSSNLPPPVAQEQRNLMASEALNKSEKTIFLLLDIDAPTPRDDVVERSGLHSSEVLATLFNLEMKSMVRQWPGKRFSKVML